MRNIFKLLFGACLVLCILIFSIIFLSMMLDAKKYSGSYIDSWVVAEYQGSEKIENDQSVPGLIFPEGKEDLDCYRVEVKMTNLSTKACYGDPAERLWWMYPVYDVYIPGDVDEESADLFAESARPGLPGKTSVTTELFLFVEAGQTEVTMTYAPNWDEKEITCEISLASAKGQS